MVYVRQEYELVTGVGGYLPNIQEAAIAMLAASSIGAVWACCGAELGQAPSWIGLARSTKSIVRC